jgi:hypothetical protein
MRGLMSEATSLAGLGLYEAKPEGIIVEQGSRPKGAACYSSAIAHMRTLHALRLIDSAKKFDNELHRQARLHILVSQSRGSSETPRVPPPPQH